MHAIKSAGRAIIRRPSAWSSGGHKKLPENWTDTRGAIIDGLTFNLLYLGVTRVDEPKGVDMAAAAVKRIISTSRASRMKSPKVSLNISTQGLVLHDSISGELMDDFSIDRVSFCMADIVFVNVFSCIIRNTLSGTLKCHAFACPKRKVAQAIMLTVGQACALAKELPEEPKEVEEMVTAIENDDVSEKSDVSCNETEAVKKENLLDLDESVDVAVETNRNVEGNLLDSQESAETNNNPAAWLSEDHLEDAFTSWDLDSNGSFADWPCHAQTPRSWTLG